LATERPLLTFTPEDFWQFSLAFYGQAKVARACLALQDRTGADVNLLLLCCWLARYRRQLDAAGLEALNAAIADWRSCVIEPLRHARRALRPSFDNYQQAPQAALRQNILEAELAAEKIAQHRLATLAAAISPPFVDAAPEILAGLMLEGYLRLHRAMLPDGEDRSDLAVILAAFAAY